MNIGTQMRAINVVAVGGPKQLTPSQPSPHVPQAVPVVATAKAERQLVTA